MRDIALIKKAFEDRMYLEASAVHRFENVTNNSVFRIETESRPYIFKVYAKRDWPEDGKLPFVCRKLTEHDIPHAQLFVFDREDARFPNGYSIEECLPGTTADRLTLSECETLRLFEKLAALVSRIHRIGMTNYGYTGGGMPALWTTFSEYMYDVLAGNADSLIAKGFMEAEELAGLNRAMYGKLKQYDIFPSVLCHGDLSAKNILVNADEITLIDWDDAQSLCWMTDVARLTFWMRIHYDERLAEACKTAFLDRYETAHDKSVYCELEDVLHVWHGLDNLTFFTEGELCERLQALVRASRSRCGL